jgi:hypothetical protein
MPLRPSLRRRTSRRRQLTAAAVLACAGGGLAALFAVGSGGSGHFGGVVVAQAQVCVSPLLNCGTPKPPPSSSSAKPPTANPKPPPTSSGSRPPSTPSGSSGQPITLQPGADALPTLPPPSPGAPPEPPELSVQGINLQLAGAPPSRPGGSTLVQATLEAQRGADTYSVPHAKVVLTIASAPGGGANVIPAELDSGDTGVVLITVFTGDRPGDTVVHAVSGSASADVTVHTDAAAAASASGGAAAGAAVSAPPGTNTRSDSRGYLIAALAALIVALIAGYITALVMGRLPNPLQRRSVWGRRSGSSGR